MAARFDLGQVITAMITPMRDNGAIDYDAITRVAKHLVANGSDAIVVAGSTGENATLHLDEEYEILRCVQSATAGRARVIMGAGSNCTDTAIARARDAATAGADAILSVVPYYNKPSQQGIAEHFGAIAAAVDVPIVLYNIPSRTGINIEPKTVATLARKYSNIVALKQSSPDMDAVSEIRMSCPDDFEIYCGDDSLTLPMLSLGARGVISVASHVVGNEIQTMINDFRAGRVNDALRMHKILYPLFKQIFVAPNPVPIKALLAAEGYIQNHVRRPLVAVDDKTTAQLVQCLKNVQEHIRQWLLFPSKSLERNTII